MLSVSSVSNSNAARAVSFGKVERTKETNEISDVNFDNTEDSFESEHLKGKRELSLKDKQQILYNARMTAAGWSILGEGISTIYYGLRSDKTIAEKFNLDLEKDAKLINQIKREQTIATLPSALCPSVGGIIAYVYCNTTNVDDIKIKE